MAKAKFERTKPHINIGTIGLGCFGNIVFRDGFRRFPVFRPDNNGRSGQPGMDDISCMACGKRQGYQESAAGKGSFHMNFSEQG